jgi:hypothetical protein
MKMGTDWPVNRANALIDQIQGPSQAITSQKRNLRQVTKIGATCEPK